MWIAMFVARYAAASSVVRGEVECEGETGDRAAGERRVMRLRPCAAQRSDGRILDDRNLIVEDERRGQAVEVHDSAPAQ